MPLEVAIDNKRRLILMRGSGVLTDADLVVAHHQCETNRRPIRRSAESAICQVLATCACLTSR